MKHINLITLFGYKMELQTFSYTKESGWSVSPFPSMDSSKTLIIIFAAQEYINNQEPILKILSSYPQAHIIGCSTAGEIMGTTVHDGLIAVAIIKFNETEIKHVCSNIENSQDSFNAGQRIAKALSNDQLKGIFILSDGLNVNGTQLIAGLNSALSNEIVVTGGLAGDQDRFKNTWVISDKKLTTHSISAIGFYGQHVHIGHGSQGGWDAFGPERRITKSKNNILYELDNRTALELYKEYLGERAKGLPATGLLFPLAIRKNTEDSKEVVRTILGINEKDQSMTFAGDMPMGYLAKLMRASFDNLITGANEAAIEAGSNQKHPGPILALAVSCVGRRLLLGEYIEEETASTLDALPKNSQQIGFYSYGEISPYSTGYCDLHNQTMTITTISEE